MAAAEAMRTGTCRWESRRMMMMFAIVVTPAMDTYVASGLGQCSDVSCSLALLWLRNF